MTPETADKLWLQLAGTFDTAIKIGLGAGLALLAERWKRGDERRNAARRRRQERIIDPIVAFVDDLLVIISATYWLTADGVTPGRPSETVDQARAEAESHELAALDARLISIRNREATVEARVGSLGSATLAQAFQELSMQLIRIRQVAKKEGFGAAREEARKAADLGAKFFAVLTSVEERDLASAPTAVTKGGRTLAKLPDNFT